MFPGRNGAEKHATAAKRLIYSLYTELAKKGCPRLRALATASTFFLPTLYSGMRAECTTDTPLKFRRIEFDCPLSRSAKWYRKAIGKFCCMMTESMAWPLISHPKHSFHYAVHPCSICREVQLDFTTEMKVL